MRKEDVGSREDVIEFLADCSPFERAVYVATYDIPYGRVCTYHGIAKAIGRPKAMRAVANALHNNPLYPIVPCWRVVKSDGSFGGEHRAAADRRDHVKSEGVPVENGRVTLSANLMYVPRTRS